MESGTGNISSGSGTISLRRVGRVVYMQIYAVNTSVAAQTAFANIPERFRPILNAYAPLSNPQDGTMIAVSASGNLTLNKATNANMYGSVCYIAAQE